MKKIILRKPINYQSLVERAHLIASYPRSGNTWTRFLIKDILSNANEELVSAGQKSKFGTAIPDIHATKNLDEIIQSEDFSGIIKTHYIDSDMNNKIIYIFRKAIDVLPSYLRFHKYSGFENYDKPYSFKLTNCFLNELISHWKTAIKIYYKSPNQIFFLSYEMLHNIPNECLKSCCNFLKFDNVSDFNISKSIKMNEFNSMKNHSFFSENRNNEVFMASGKVGAGTMEFNTMLKMWVEIKSLYYYKKLHKNALINCKININPVI